MVEIAIETCLGVKTVRVFKIHFVVMDESIVRLIHPTNLTAVSPHERFQMERITDDLKLHANYKH